MARALGRAFAARSQTGKIAHSRVCIGKATVLTKKMRAEILRRCGVELVVPLVDGLYCEEWLWLPDLLPEELEAWWCALENVETFWNERSRSTWPGTFILVGEDMQFFDLWESAWNAGAYRVRVEFNEQSDSASPDSYLRKADGTVILHKGAFHPQVANRSGGDES